MPTPTPDECRWFVWRQESHHCRALQCARFREGYLAATRMFDDPRFGERLISGDYCEGCAI
jgi:hypothetical protein